MVRDYLMALKNKGNFKFAELSNLSGIPEPTIRKIFSGETPDPRFETVAKLVAAMGGTLDDAVSSKKEKEIADNVVTTLKTESEMRIDELKERLASLEKDKRILAIAVAALVGVVVLLLVFDMAIGAHGWVQY